MEFVTKPEVVDMTHQQAERVTATSLTSRHAHHVRGTTVATNMFCSVTSGGCCQVVSWNKGHVLGSVACARVSGTKGRKLFI